MSAHVFSFYLPSLVAGERLAELAGEEHSHLKRVLRLRAGEMVRVTNGRGLVATAVIESVGDSATVARVVETGPDESPASRLALALPLLRRAHFDAAVAQCVEVGMTELIPVRADKCHVREWTPALSSRAERVAIAAMKQSGRGWLPPVRDAVDVDGLAAMFPDFGAVVLADAAGEPFGAAEPRAGALAIVGPEGGFSEREDARLSAAGARRVSIGSHRLRTETAALVLVSLLAPGRREPVRTPRRGN